jgi:hypothetical protein
MKRWKIAISIAVVGAVAGPFILGTYKMRPTPKRWDLYDTLVPLTADQRENLEYFVGQTNNCETLRDSHLNFFVCQMSQKDLERGATYVTALSIDKYMAINAAVMVGGFIGGFGATFLVPALALRYWKWLHE